MIYLCAFCGQPNSVRGTPDFYFEQRQNDVQCSRCKGIVRITTTVLRRPEKRVSWNQVKGIMDIKELDTIEQQRCPHGKGSPRTCLICSEAIKGGVNV